MKTLKESLLKDMEDTLESGEKDVDNVVKGIIPTVKDFQKNPYASYEQIVIWKCPFLMQKYKQKYPEIFKNPKNQDYTCILIMIDAHWKEMKIYLGENDSITCKRKLFLGWNETNLKNRGGVAICRKLAIELINKFANDEKTLDTLFSQEQYIRNCKNEWEAAYKMGLSGNDMPVTAKDMDLLRLLK